MTALVVAFVVLACAVRVAYFARVKVAYSPADESDYVAMAKLVARFGLVPALRAMAAEWLTTPRIQHKPPPVRVLWILWGGFAACLTERVHRAYALAATLAGCLMVVLATATAWRLYGAPAAVATSALVGTCPLALGLGRRALIDAPTAAAQMFVVFVATLGPTWFAALLVALVAMLLLKESTRTVFVPLALWAWWCWGWGAWWFVAFTFALAWAWYEWALVALTGHRVWTFRRVARSTVHHAARGIHGSDYGRTYCRGGLHRLVVDLTLVSPGVVLLTPLAWGAPGALALGMLAVYSSPRLSQQIRTSLVADVMLRVGVAVVAPWWVVIALCAFDIWVFWRAWLRRGLYDPTTAALACALDMGPVPS